MVGNENIHVRFEYNNIFVVDPNKVINNENGKPIDRVLKHEELVMYVNLSCNQLPRTRMVLGVNGDIDAIEEFKIAEINYVKPDNKPYLDTSWTEYARESDNNESKKLINNPTSLDNIVNNTLNPGVVNRDTPLLGIISINITVGLSLVSEVKIDLEDIRGRALFESGQNSPYSAFFNYPYPIFNLTFKGYLGKSMKYQLNLIDFSAKFNSQSGNFLINLTFQTYKFSVFAELQTYLLFAVPHMYKTTYVIGETSDQSNQVQSSINQTTTTGSQTTNAKTITTSKGRQKISEMYNEYKSKGLIDENFPDFTFPEFLQKVEILENNIEDTFNKVEMSVLSDLEVYSKNIQELITAIEASQESWMKKWLDLDSYFVLNNNSGNEKAVVYTLKKEKSDSQSAENAKTELTKLFIEYNSKLNENPSCGQYGKYTIGGETKETPILAEFSYNKVEIDLQVSDIDWNTTFRRQTKKNDKDPDLLTAVDEFTRKISESIFNTNFVEKDGKIKPKTYFYCFECKGSYQEQKKNIIKRFDEIKQQIENDYTKRLSEKLQNPNENGLGFIPTIRNVFAIFMASVEGYIRLLDDVHKKAWELRGEDLRKSAVSSSTVSPDMLGEKYPVYPWPSYVIETSDKNSKYQNRYPGEPDLINKTEAFRYDIWPEVEFVEELVRAIAVNDPSQPDSKQPSNEINGPNRVSLSVIEYPVTNTIYSNLQTTKYFYEIWERTYISSFYQRLNRGNGNFQEVFDVLADIESDNILTSLETTNPNLINLLKNFKFDSENIIDVLRHYSNNGTGESWQLFIRNNYITPYIKNRITTDFIILPNSKIFDDTEVPSKNIKQINKVKNLLKSTTSNELEFTDIYPFTNNLWLKNNIQGGNGTNNVLFNNTNKIIEYNEDKKIFANFQKSTDTKEKRPITHFNYKSPDSTRSKYLRTFYSDLEIKNQYITEGTLQYSFYDTELVAKQATSILNTPYFINSIISGVKKFQAYSEEPYTNAAYLFLNSLPLITLREKYKTDDSSGTNYLDYISATLRKFGALHKLPYSWVLKYGSIWWRYKKWVESGKTIDPISTDWINFNQNFNYDPVNSDPKKRYNVNITNPDGTTSPTTIVLQDDKIDTLTFSRHTTICSGFYPNLLNEFNLFLQGLYLFNFTYTDADIQNGIDNYGLKLIPGTDQSNLFYGINFITRQYNNFDILFTATTYSGRTLSYKTYSAYVTDIKNKNNVFILPSFGSNVNQCKQECFSQLDDYFTMTTELYNNQSLFDGSVRCFWNASHYGYFNHQKISIPKPTEYLKQIYINQEDQENFIIANNGYTDISEIFSVFDKKMLDKFEEEFLKFSRSAYTFTSPDNLLGSEKIYYNFQLLLRQLMSVPKPSEQNFENIINELQGYQLKTISSVLQGFLEHDIIIKHGNPSKFDRKMFYSLSKTKLMEDKYKFNSYKSTTPNALPYIGSTTTLALSRTNYPTEWETIDLYLGFSTIPELEYKDSGSYITDFFIDLNVEFNKENIIAFQDIIKIYATQKLLDNTLTDVKFLESLDKHIDNCEKFQNDIITSLFTKLKTALPNVTVTETKTPPIVDGNISKIDIYYGLKALNDKWIAGNDFSFKTFLEDFLFLDSANRDIGNVVILDIFSLSNERKYYESQKTIFNLIGTIGKMLNMVINVLPGYINYYGVVDQIKDAKPNPLGSNELANTLFGTHLTVDYSLSTPKFIFYLPDNSSENLKIDDKENVPYKDDGFLLEDSKESPAFESQENKKDWAFSNKVVGFDVNFGIQNQNVFTNLSIDMDSGKASLASMEATVGMATNYNKKTSSQTLSLLNFYQKRSYTCEVSMLGNAIIQPGMWFNLNHVPLFAGTYKIYGVTHNISPGSFETRLVGMRQKIYSYPVQFDYLQSINKRLLSKVRSKLPKPDSTISSTPTDIKSQKTEIVKNVENQKTPTSVNSCELIPVYNRYVDVDPVLIKMSYTEMLSYINNFSNTQTTQRETISKVMFSIIYVESSDSSETELISYNNNFAGVKLTKDWGQIGKTYFDSDKYICLKGSKDNVSVPYAVFKSLDDNIKFLFENLKYRISVLTGTSFTDISKLYVDYWQKNEKIYEKMTISEKDVIHTKINKALNLWLSNNGTSLPSPQTNIFDVNYLDINGKPQLLQDDIELIKVDIKTNVGLWEITNIEGYIIKKDNSPSCLTSFSELDNDGLITNNGQTYIFTVRDYKDLLEQINCTNSTDTNTFMSIYVVITADPIISFGVVDQTRKRYIERFDRVYPF